MKNISRPETVKTLLAGGAVKALNAVEQRLDTMLKEKDLPPYLCGDVKAGL